MKKIFTIALFSFMCLFVFGEAQAFYGINPHPSYYSYRTVYPGYNGYGYGYNNVLKNNYRRHPIKDKKQLKYMKEYYSAVNGTTPSGAYQSGNKVVNVNVAM